MYLKNSYLARWKKWRRKMEMINVLEKNVSKKIAKNIMRLISVIRRDSSEISCQINISKVESRLVVITTEIGRAHV